jgi:hypothetical protein
MQYNGEVERGGGAVPLPRPPPVIKNILDLGLKLYIYKNSIDGNMNWVHGRGRKKHKPTLKLYKCTHSKDGEILAFGFHSLSQKQIKCIGVQRATQSTNSMGRLEAKR